MKWFSHSSSQHQALNPGRLAPVPEPLHHSAAPPLGDTTASPVLSQKRNQGLFVWVLFETHDPCFPRPVGNTNVTKQHWWAESISHQEQKGGLPVRLQMFWSHQDGLWETEGSYLAAGQQLSPCNHLIVVCFSCEPAQRERRLWSQRYECSDPWDSRVSLQINKLIFICTCPTDKIGHITSPIICKGKQHALAVLRVPPCPYPPTDLGPTQCVLEWSLPGRLHLFSNT